MSTSWPSLDTHAHIDVTIPPTELLNLRAVIFAASRSLEESRRALERQPKDLLTIWGLGVHPGVKAALDSFEPNTFCSLLGKTAYVGEIGLDGKVKSRIGRQREVFASALHLLQKQPRMTSVHSYAATKEVVEELARTPIQGAILHWWLGDRATTELAIDLGAYFSVNASCLRRTEVLDVIPLDRLLLETDHPDGNRLSGQPRRPGSLRDVEFALADRRGVSRAALREKIWQNLAKLISDTACGHLLPPRVRSILEATR